MIFNWFKKQQKFKFLSYIGDYSIHTPVKAAKDIRAVCASVQKGKPAAKRYQICPGLTDFANSGYIITAHTDIHIKANSIGTMVKVDWPSHITSQQRRVLEPKPFEYEIVDGLVKIEGVKKAVNKIPTPWMIESPEGYSAYILPAIMHSDFLDKIHVYPGITDSDRFYTVNFVFSAVKECEFIIPAGTPLLQVIFFKRETFVAECRKSSEHEIDKYFHNKVSSVSNFYRRHFYGKKSYKVECPHINKDRNEE